MPSLFTRQVQYHRTELQQHGDIVHRLKVVLEAHHLHLYNTCISGTPSSEEKEFKAH